MIFPDGGAKKSLDQSIQDALLRIRFFLVECARVTFFFIFFFRQRLPTSAGIWKRWKGKWISSGFSPGLGRF